MLANPIEKVMKWLKGPSDFPVVLIGEGGSGKTTFLSQLINGKALYTIPTLGHQLYHIDYKKYTFSIWDTGMGCFRDPNWPQYFHSSETSILFFHDCTVSEESLDLNLELLFRVGAVVREVGYRIIWIVLNKQDCLPAQDIEHLRQVYDRTLNGILDNPVNCRVIGYPVSAKTGEGVTRVMDDLLSVMTGKEIEILQHVEKPQPQWKCHMSNEEPRALIEEEGAKDTMDPREFWKSFLGANLLEWDHRCHLKAGYIVVLESLQKGEHVFVMAEIFLCHLRRLKTMKPESFRNTEHRTMTIFWLAQIQSAIIKYRSHQLDATELPSWTDFQSVLLHTPSLMNTSLWIQYYTKENIFSKAARESWCPPDKKPLPGLSASNQDHPFVRANDPDRLLRYAFSVVQDTLKSGARRGQVIKEALELLQVTTIRLRGTNPAVPPYSETQAYFWIQIVHAAIQSFAENPGNSTSEASILDVSVSRLSSASFNVLFGLNSDSWKQYYSDEVWTSIGARMTFIPPDIRPLPSLIVPSSRSQERRALLYQTAEALSHRGDCNGHHYS